MHAYEPEDLTPEQREWAEAANHHHARIQTLLMRIAVSGQQTRSILECEMELAALAHKLNYANLQLWKATTPAAERALTCAKAVVSHLAASFSPVALDNVIINARYAREALTGMTDAQRRTMLEVREVALAKDIADDCEAEFNNTQAWARWRMKAGLERRLRCRGCAVSPMTTKFNRRSKRHSGNTPQAGGLAFGGKRKRAREGGLG